MTNLLRRTFGAVVAYVGLALFLVTCIGGIVVLSVAAAVFALSVGVLGIAAVCVLLFLYGAAAMSPDMEQFMKNVMENV